MRDGSTHESVIFGRTLSVHGTLKLENRNWKVGLKYYRRSVGWVERYENRWPGCKEVAAARWIKRYSVRNQLLVNVLKRDIDRGEAESIVLAIELEADLILLDEKEGRHAAQRLGLKMVGVSNVACCSVSDPSLRSPWLGGLLLTITS